MPTKILIIGPNPKDKLQGGVSTHISSLISLDALSNATIFDPQSLGNKWRNIFKIIGNIKQLSSLSRCYQIALINSSIYPASLIKLLIILCLCRVNKLTVFFHGGRFSRIKYLQIFFFKKLFWHFLKGCHSFYFLSSQQLLEFKKIFPKSNCLLYRNYSFDESIIQKIKHEPFAFIFVGRVVKEKGIHQLVEGVKLLDQDQTLPPFIVKIVGDGPALDEIQSCIGPSSRYEFKGFLSGEDLINQYRQCDVLVFPTFHPEGFPYVVIEAMRAGMPVISTSEGALESLVADGVNGFKVNAKDPHGLAEKMKFFLLNRDKFDEMSVHCHAIFEETMTKKSAEIFYQNLINSLKA